MDVGSLGGGPSEDTGGIDPWGIPPGVPAGGGAEGSIPTRWLSPVKNSAAFLPLRFRRREVVGTLDGGPLGSSSL